LLGVSLPEDNDANAALLQPAPNQAIAWVMGLAQMCLNFVWHTLMLTSIVVSLFWSGEFFELAEKGNPAPG
jgi:hypothetical protein